MTLPLDARPLAAPPSAANSFAAGDARRSGSIAFRPRPLAPFLLGACFLLGLAGPATAQAPAPGPAAKDAAAKAPVAKDPATKDPATKDPAKRWNVLFVAVDDLRPELACYGRSIVKSPNIDRLAQEGVRFDRAYCQQAVCNPSRASLLTGLRPETLKVFDLETHFRDKVPTAVALPQLFKENGYATARYGKIFHTGHGNRDDDASWSEPQLPGPKKPGAKTPAAKTPGAGQGKPTAEKQAGGGAKADESGRKHGGQAPYEVSEASDEALADGVTADRAIAHLQRLQDRPFFLAVGFIRPHLPFVAPKKYWDLYRPEEIPLATNPQHPKNAPLWTGSGSGELRQYADTPAAGPISAEQARKLVHGYYASVSYMDAQLGRVMAELERLGLKEKTIVVLWGDHGWQLGEHGMWCKHTNYETSTRSPLIVCVPGSKSAGKSSPALVELVDVYPTLAELCGLKAPAELEGTSLAPLLVEPARPWKTAAFSVYPRGPKEHGRLMGWAVRTADRRYVEWRKVAGGEVVLRELYDHRTDPQEDVNVAEEPAQAAAVAEMAAILKSGWKGAAPKLAAVERSGDLLALADDPKGRERAAVEVREVEAGDVHLGFQPEGRPTKPRVVETEEELGKAVTNEAARKQILGSVDFAKEKLYIFSWKGSGQDKLTASVAASEDDPKAGVVRFRYKGGLTRDLRSHLKLFAAPSGLPWKVVD